MREDALSLYGFATRLEQDLFERLIGVSGIGPKVALAVLSGIEPPESDPRDRARRPGAADGDSRRRQEDLRADRARAEGPAAAGRAGAPAGERRRAASLLRDDLLSALINLGYHRPLAEKAVEAAIKRTPDGDFERTLKQALRELAK